MTLVTNVAHAQMSAMQGARTELSSAAHNVVQVPAKRAPMRLTRRGRAVFATIFAAPLLVLLIHAGLSGVAAIGSDTPGSPLQYVTVSQGQSLWNIATTIAPEADPRDVVQDIVTMNHLESTVVHGGQSLAVPDYAEAN